MPLFAYRARDQRGILITGHLEGLAANPVRNLLSEQGLIPLSIKLVQTQKNWFPQPAFLKKVKAEEIVLMTRQFHTLFKAGMSMENLLGTLARQTKNKTLNETLQRIQTDVSQGSTLAKAFAKHPKIFSELYINMLSAGEEAGILEEVLKNLSDLLEKEVEIKTGVKSATLYPKIVIGVLCIAIVVMLIWVIPEFTKFYAHYKTALPLPTRMLTFASNAVRYYGWVLLVVGIGAWFGFRKYISTPGGRLRYDRLRWKLPVFGDLSQKIANARFARILSSLYRSGLSITKGLSLVEPILDNELIAKDIRLVRSQIERGQGIAESMKQTETFQPMLIEATAIGEKTGSLDDMLQGMAEHYEMEIHHMVKNLTTLLEPILLVFIFGMVTFFVLAIFLPIWNLSSAVLH